MKLSLTMIQCNEINEKRLCCLAVILETPRMCTNASEQSIIFLMHFFSDFNMGVPAIVNSIRQYFSINPETTSIYVACFTVFSLSGGNW